MGGRRNGKISTLVLLSLMALLLLPKGVFSQNFSKVFNLPAFEKQWGGWGVDVLTIDDSIALTRHQWLCSDSLRSAWHIDFTVLKSNGIKSTLKIRIPDTTISGGYARLTKLEDSIYLAIGYSVASYDSQGTAKTYPWLLWLRLQGDSLVLIRSRTYKNIVCCQQQDLLMSCTLFDDKIFLIGQSYTSDPINSSQILFASIDTSGNLQKVLQIGVPNRFEYAHHLAARTPSTMLIAANSNGDYTINGYENMKATIYCVDTSGNKLWDRQMWNNTSSIYSYIYECKKHPKHYFYSALKDTVVPNPNGYHGQSNLAYVDSNANIIWEHLFYAPNELVGVYGLQPLRSGNIIACGSVGDKIAFVAQITLTGQLLWQRYYKSAESSEFNVLVACAESPNGDLIFTGSARTDSIPSVQGVWLMRVDSNGCLKPDSCMAPTAIEVLLPQVAQLEIYPNPSADVVNINAGQGNRLNGMLNVYDVQGKKMCTRQCDNIMAQQLFIATWPSGIYFVQFQSKDGVVVTRKLVKE
jgi:Secretion system C-terminal sorting domain